MNDDMAIGDLVRLSFGGREKARVEATVRHSRVGVIKGWRRSYAGVRCPLVLWSDVKTPQAVPVASLELVIVGRATDAFE
jgi:hypothetical protein